MTLYDCLTCGKKHRTQNRVELCHGYVDWNRGYAEWKSSFEAGAYSPEGSREREPYPEALSSFPGFTDQKRDYYWPVLVKVVQKRDNMTCQDCRIRTANFEVHHIIPRGMGGSDHPANLKLVCQNCHKKYNEKFNGQIISKKAQERKTKAIKQQMPKSLEEFA